MSEQFKEEKSPTPEEKQDLVSVLGRTTDLINFVTKEPVKLGELIFQQPDIRELFNLARSAQPEDGFSARFWFVRNLDNLYNAGDERLSAQWYKIKSQIGSEDEAFNLLLKLTDCPDFAEKYERNQNKG